MRKVKHRKKREVQEESLKRGNVERREMEMKDRNGGDVMREKEDE